MVRRAVLQRLQKKIRHTEWTAANIKAQTAQLFNAMPSACLIVDSGQRIVKMNQAAHTLLMRENENREGQLFWYKLLPNSAEQPREVLVERFLQRKNLNGVVQGDAFLLNRDGESFMAHWSDIPLRDVGGELIGYFFIIDDISERHHFERSLRKLTQDLLSTQQDERARLAQVLHDDIAQQLSAMRLMVEAAEKRRRNEGGDDAAVFEQVLPLIKESVEDVLNIIRQRLNDLRPPLLNELGLACALEHEVKRLSQSTTAELQCQLSALQSWRTLPMVEYVCFYILREALFNAIKHSGAQTIRVAVKPQHRDWVFCVSDDGLGFRDDPIHKPGRLGMVGMRERASSIGAELHFQSSGAGTVVTLRVPITALIENEHDKSIDRG